MKSIRDIYLSVTFSFFQHKLVGCCALDLSLISKITEEFQIRYLDEILQVVFSLQIYFGASALPNPHENVPKFWTDLGHPEQRISIHFIANTNQHFSR